MNTNIKRDDYKVLVIEDNPGDFALVEDFLFERIEVPQIVHAKNFRQAHDIIVTSDTVFDIILLDLSLPDKTGEELIKEVVDISKDVPVVVLTGYTDIEFGAKSLSLGISDYMLKEELTALSLYKSIMYSLERKRIALAVKTYIKAIEAQNEQLKQISWMQSHIIRAPLARIMGLVPLIRESNGDDKDLMLEFLSHSAIELDEVINNITDKSQQSDYQLPSL